MTESFSQQLLIWFDQNGRKDLPWQSDTTPYRVWISEIMLQQTQVATVIPYYERFMQSFPDISTLAAAPIDDVLHHWSGLGYYARARNLHKAASQIITAFEGVFPLAIEQVESLPGIGRSTASAILAIADHQAHAILDGNVKRVLARFHAVQGWPGQKSVSDRMWLLAESHTPIKRVADYTQAIMDLGATLCTRSKPQCDHCPVGVSCVARIEGTVSEFPHRKPKKEKPVKATQMLLIRNSNGEVLLEQRPPTGIWGGLWSLPEVAIDAEPVSWCEQVLGRSPVQKSKLTPLRHSFSHYHLDISTTLLDLTDAPVVIRDGDRFLWFSESADRRVGLPAPVQKLLKQGVEH